MSHQTISKHTLEPAAQALADATSQPPFLYELGPEGARKMLNPVRETAATTAALEQAIHVLRRALRTS